jgi:hypothetical protein
MKQGSSAAADFGDWLQFWFLAFAQRHEALALVLQGVMR